jgi:hypothetical protein
VNINDCTEWLLTITRNMREQGADVPQVHMDIDEGVGPAMPLSDELELLAVNIENAAKAILTEHWQTVAVWGGEERAVCGRCKYGDGVPYLWPCFTRRFVTGEPEPPYGTPEAQR